MVVTRVGGLHEVVPDGKVGYVTEPDPQRLSDAIVRFFEEPIPRLQENILEEKKKYSWEVFTATLLDTAFSR